MTNPAPVAPSRQERIEALYTWAFNPDAVAIRQAPFTIAFLASFGLTIFSAESPHRAWMWLGLAIVAVVQVAGLVVPWRRLPAPWQSLLPLAQMAALVILEYGSGTSLTYFTALIFLPVVSLALQRGIAGVVLAVAGSLAVVQSLALLRGDSDWHVAVTRTVVVPLTALLAALGVHGVTYRLRNRTRAAEALQAEKELSLVEAHQRNAALSLMTERLRETSDSLFGLINAATRHAIIGTDDSGQIMVFNEGAEELLGYPRSVALGMSIASVYDEDELRAAVTERGLPWDRASRRAIAVGEAVEGGTNVREWTLRRRDGEAVPVQVAVTRRPALEDGRPAGFLFVATDVTERRESERLQDEFVGLVSHELRTPLTGILGYLELMGMGPDPLTAEQKADLEVIDRNAQRLLRLVNDLLLSVQLSAGTFSLIPEDIDLGAVVRESVQAIEPVAQTAGVELTVEADRPVPLYADPVRLAQVVENLLGNAVKFTPKGGSVSVRCYPGVTVEDSHTGIVQVIDTGIGIGPAEVERLTERFFRAKSARNLRIRGIGLGLPIAQAIVDAHGGRMTVTSALGSGTTFLVTIPDVPRVNDRGVTTVLR